MRYQNTAQFSSASEASSRDAFARECVFGEFEPRDARRGFQHDFRDRLPHEQPRHVGDVTKALVPQIARRTVDYWMKSAALALSAAERDEALGMAHQVAAQAGIDWPDDRSEAA
jgi:hypothetical protein